MTAWSTFEHRFAGTALVAVGTGDVQLTIVWWPS